MSRYLFNNNSLIKEVSIQRSEGGGIRAYVYARENAKAGKLSAIKDTLIDNSYQWAPIFVAGRHALEVRGLNGDETKLLSLLHAKEYITGSYEKKANIGDVMTFSDKFKKNTLRASGFTFFTADILFFSYEWKKAFKNGKLVDLPGILAGIFYAAGTPFLAFFGKGDKSDFQLKDISTNTIEHLKKDGIPVPKDSSIRAVSNGHNATHLRKALNFCSRYPSELANSFFGVAGAMMIWAGLKDYAHHKTNGSSAKTKSAIYVDIALGAMTVLAGLLSVFIEEEAREPGEPKKKGVAGIWQWIKEKPLRAAGGALIISTLGHAYSASKDWRNSQNIIKNAASFSATQLAEARVMRKAVPGRAASAAINFTAEALMTVSSKGHGAGVKSDSSLDRSVYAVMADFVSRSPQIDRNVLLGKISDYLADKKHLGGRAADIENGIRDQLKELDKNPWANHPAKVAKESTTQEIKTNWREKTITQSAPAMSMAAAIS